jgi:hypothetical protein
LALKAKQAAGWDWDYVKTYFRDHGFRSPTQTRFKPTEFIGNLDQVTSPGYHFVSFGNRGIVNTGEEEGRTTGRLFARIVRPPRQARLRLHRMPSPWIAGRTLCSTPITVNSGASSRAP